MIFAPQQLWDFAGDLQLDSEPRFADLAGETAFAAGVQGLGLSALSKCYLDITLFGEPKKSHPVMQTRPRSAMTSWRQPAT